MVLPPDGSVLMSGPKPTTLELTAQKVVECPLRRYYEHRSRGFSKSLPSLLHVLGVVLDVSLERALAGCRRGST